AYSHKWIPYDKLINNAVKIGRTILTAWIKQVPDLLFSYLHLTLSGVFLLLFLRSHYLPAG
ncbi:hypothetical protein QPL15_25025, partial [Escherichia coli]|uniref:hypothetical protein n=1 Tax=Escherichia coli TaxID=562 RepID=UPI0026666910